MVTTSARSVENVKKQNHFQSSRKGRKKRESIKLAKNFILVSHNTWKTKLSGQHNSFIISKKNP